jgi:signal transduction histidine kinase
LRTLRSLESEVDRLIRLSKDLLFIARLDQGRNNLTFEPVDVGEMLTIVVAHFQPLAAERSIALETSAPAGLTITGDVELLTRLLFNLLDNAVKFSPDGGRVSAGAHRSAGSVAVTVSDSGPGIAREHLPHLFERFYRVESDRGRFDQSGEQGGSGLGLAIAYEIAQAHRGAIEVTSEPGNGTTVIVRLSAAGS